MKIFKKFLPLIICFIVLLIGIVLVIKNKGANFFSQDNFLTISLLIVGGIGTVASFFIIASSKKFEEIENDNNYSAFSSTVKQKLQELKEQNEVTEEKEIIKNNHPEVTQEIKHKKIKCNYCKCKFDDSLSRCPNCGAPPDLEV